ncbi:MAG: DEAD/DEAH box helicase, partial [Acidobacteriota bacterium]
QAIKNAATQSSKSVRLLQASHRLALSGTPIENHLGELWSLFEFLNPGVLGASASVRGMGSADRMISEEGRKLLARALRPYILRRTKDEVAKELPSRTEQTIHCEMEAKQRKIYDELRLYYQRSLQQRIQDVGLNKAKIHVLEALLRLRQAACHPGLVDPKRRGEASAKLDTLLPRIREIVEGGHKVLVFSQFTSFLSIVRERLDEEGISYCYLDGRTRDRAAVVDQFQNDPATSVFLISLKAGGLGLNLTAAEYVFLLDPWWNPAVEAQAIDRAHRIGQTRHVVAYRLVCKDTVEEKILELQATKRELADSILGGEGKTLRNLEAADIEMLFS